MTIALLTGSMNPFTHGHKHLVDISMRLFDELVIGIGANPDKKASDLFTSSERVELTKQCVAEFGDRVGVQTYEGATVDFALSISATAMVRGIRNGTDHAYEASMTYANTLMSELEGGRLIPTVYFQCPPALMEVSSTRVRELIALGRGHQVLGHYVMPPVIQMLEAKQVG
jgi:pantetheine-phosphate adenylyltransferase